MSKKISFDNGEYISIPELIDAISNIQDDKIHYIMFDVDDSGTEISLYGVEYND